MRHLDITRTLVAHLRALQPTTQQTRHEPNLQPLTPTLIYRLKIATDVISTAIHWLNITSPRSLIGRRSQGGFSAWFSLFRPGSLIMVIGMFWDRLCSCFNCTISSGIKKAEEILDIESPRGIGVTANK